MNDDTDDRKYSGPSDPNTTVPSGMRKRLTSYGNPDFSLFLRSVFLHAMGYLDDVLNRPLIRLLMDYACSSLRIWAKSQQSVRGSAFSLLRDFLRCGNYCSCFP